VLVERQQVAVAPDVLDDPLVLARQRPQVELVVRVGQEAHVEGEVGVARGAVLVAEGVEGHRQAPGRVRDEHLGGELAAQHGGAQAGRVDAELGAVAQALEQRALGGNPGGHAARRRERVAPARLLVTRQQRLLVGLEEQHTAAQPQRREVVEHRGQRLEEVAAAHVGDDGGALDLRSLVHEELDERADHLRRQVVHAEVAGVLEDVHGGRLAGAGVARDDDEVLQPRVGEDAGRPGGGALARGALGGGHVREGSRPPGRCRHPLVRLRCA